MASTSTRLLLSPMGIYGVGKPGIFGDSSDLSLQGGAVQL